MTYPSDRSYSHDHEWISHDSPAKVGITAFAAQALDEAVYVELPEVGATLTAGEPCGEIESVKSVSDLVAPASGTVTAINDAVAAEPQLATDEPHINWLYQIDVTALGDLMNASEYEGFAKEQ
ncbi:MAG: glycine cleavage system protein GcvH [Ancrocorticia sp.]|jgi:glycine cleavage system H protein|nr:glycine cleavage system protein GcvH [Ancrocorticia sp.]MCI1962960.1 glycine cleavage system protein GcvH [Ancrocorticia sp.]MCI2001328.1 glycine cleavage system protein GcvH [Ancrocorticia sp.]MCI2028978.1 glycine cleavage system protein GcvH [Ancrocorticia sp.]